MKPLPKCWLNNDNDDDDNNNHNTQPDWKAEIHVLKICGSLKDKVLYLSVAPATLPNISSISGPVFPSTSIITFLLSP